MSRDRNIITVFKEELSRLERQLQILKKEQNNGSITLFAIIQLDRPIAEIRTTIKRIERTYWGHRHRIRDYKQQLRTINHGLEKIETKQRALKESLVDKIPEQIKEISTAFSQAQLSFWAHTTGYPASILTAWRRWQDTFWDNFIQLHQIASYYTVIQRHETWNGESTTNSQDRDLDRLE